MRVSASRAATALTRSSSQRARISGASMPRKRTLVVTSMPGQMRTRASKVSPSITRSNSAGWPLRSAGGKAVCGEASLAPPPAPAGAIHAPAARPAAKAAAASSSAPPRAGAADVFVRSMVLGITSQLRFAQAQS